MATLYEVLDGLPTVYAQAGAMEQTAFKDVAADVTLTDQDQRQVHVDDTAGPITVTAPDSSSVYPGYTLEVRKITALGNLITISGNGINIDGAPSIAFNAAYGVRQIQYIPASNSAPAQYIVIKKVG